VIVDEQPSERQRLRHVVEEAAPGVTVSERGAPEAVGHRAEVEALREELSACRAALQVAHDRAVEATRLKLEFLANLSHEIRTPLQGVFEMVDLLGATPLSERQQRYAETARHCGQRLLDVVTEVLELAQMVSGKLELVEDYFDLRRVTEDAIGGVAAAATAKELQLDWAVAEPVPWVLRGDAGRLRQVLVKLLENAVKFTDRGAVSVRAALEACTAASATVRFSVADSGVGIAEDRLSRIFHSFSQGDGSSSRRYEGTGLGLAIAKRFVERMGGVIGVESRQGVGSTFWFTVRLRRDGAADHRADGAPGR
jgi:signal transduction histidine kinase